MSDLAAGLLALGVVAGALAGRPFPILVALLGVAAALALRRPVLLIIACALLASCLSARAADGAGPLPARRYAGWVTLLSDPAPAPGGVKVVVRVGAHHVELWAHGQPARTVSGLLAGDRVAVRGVLRPVPARSRARDAHRHVVARLTIDDVIAVSAANPLQRAANWVHHTLTAGAQVLPRRARGLYLGFVIGDRRGIDAATDARFEAAGLMHLLAVSGENVAFVLAAAGPLLSRLRIHTRAVAALAVIGFFATVTRFEPSVLRASAMAAIAAIAAASGRPASGLRLLGLAVAGLVLVDPFLVWSVGFRLSVGASLGILLLARPIAARCPGPRAVAEAIAVSAAAQIGVAPVAIPVFGSMPLAALPANLLVAPVVGPLMMWGLVAGLPAGLLGERAGHVLHLPTHAAIAWVDGVARAAAALPPVSLDARAATLVGVSALAVGGAWLGRRWRRLGSPPWGPSARRSSSAAGAMTSRPGRS